VRAEDLRLERPVSWPLEGGFEVRRWLAAEGRFDFAFALDLGRVTMAFRSYLHSIAATRISFSDRTLWGGVAGRRGKIKRNKVMAVLDVGAKVRVLGGPFAGRVGVISELDGRGGARVTLGLLSARVLLENLGPARDIVRPSLQSSHRRLASAPSGDVRPTSTRSKKSRSSRRTPHK
jgi:hypothetical protein